MLVFVTMRWNQSFVLVVVVGHSVQRPRLKLKTGSPSKNVNADINDDRQKTT